MPPTNPVRQAQQSITAKDYQGAIRVLEPYLDRVPSDLDALHLAGVAYFETKQFAAAEGVYLQMWSLQPNDVRATYGVAIAAERAGRPTDAERWFRATLALDPGFDRAATRLARLQATPGAPHASDAGNRRPSTAVPRPLTTLVVPSSQEEVAAYERWAREKARIDTMNQYWYGIPWPVRALQVLIGIAVLIGFIAFLVNTGL